MSAAHLSMLYLLKIYRNNRSIDLEEEYLKKLSLFKTKYSLAIVGPSTESFRLSEKKTTNLLRCAENLL